jgi:hypothetical protein
MEPIPMSQIPSLRAGVEGEVFESAPARCFGSQIPSLRAGVEGSSSSDDSWGDLSGRRYQASARALREAGNRVALQGFALSQIPSLRAGVEGEGFITY